MKILTILEKIITGKQVKFSITTVKSSSFQGNKVIKVEDILDKKSKKYYIYHSLINFVRFKNWNNKIATADIQIIKKPFIIDTNGDKLYPIQINTEVEIEKKNVENRDSWYDEF